MKDIEGLCLNCFKELTEGAVCAECGFDNDTKNDVMYLPAKTVLNGKYVVGAAQKHESDSVTYSGYDIQLDKKIVIREFFPKGIVNRLEGASEIHVRQKYISVCEKYKQSFYKLWTTLEKMHSLSAVVPVYDVFEENETVYAIIEHLECIPLREYLLRNENGNIPWENARLMFMPVLTTLEALHNNGIVHGSITPDNLILCRDGKVRLSPFCIQESADITSDLEFISHDGYTALEQYENNHKICPATDIYAFSACIYRALVGTNPADALSRETNDKLMIPNSIAETIPIHVIKAIGSGMQIYPEKRTKNISDFRELLDAAPAVKAKADMESLTFRAPNADTSYTDYTRYEEEQQNKRSRAIIIVLVLLIVAAIAVGVWFVYVKPDTSVENTTTTAASAQYEVPDFVSEGVNTQSDIENNGVWNDRFTITFDSEYSTDAEEGIIFKQSVPAGEVVNAKTEIVLTVSKGIQTETVPDVGGLPLEEATKQLEALGFKVSSVEVYNDGTHAQNAVKSTSASAPAAGETVAVGEEIILQVYGEVQTTKPTTEATE